MKTNDTVDVIMTIVTIAALLNAYYLYVFGDGSFTPIISAWSSVICALLALNIITRNR